VEEMIFDARPGARDLRRNFRARVEYVAIMFGGGRAGAFRFAVIGEASARARGEVEPAEECLRQRDLMEGVRARSRKRGHDDVGVGELAAIPASRTLAFVKQGRVKNLLAKAGETDVREAFDCLEEIVHARLGQRVEAPVLPDLI